MSDFSGLEDILEDFLVEGRELLNDVDNRLVELEHRPGDLELLNVIFRGFHTIKGGAGFLNATELVKICHLTENLFDLLRTGQLAVSGPMMDVILEATATVRNMFADLSRQTQPPSAEPGLLNRIERAIAGELKGVGGQAVRGSAVQEAAAVSSKYADSPVKWDLLYLAIKKLIRERKNLPPEPVAAAAPRQVAQAPVTQAPVAQAPVAAAAPTANSLAAAASAASAASSAAKAASPAPAPAPAAAVPAPKVAAPASAMIKAPVQSAERAGAGEAGGRAGVPARGPAPGAAAAAAASKREPVRENSIRVDTARLDQVLNLSGEIGLTKNRLNSLRSDILAGKTDPETLHNFDNAVSQLDVLVSDLQNAVMKTRMQPIGRLFQKYPRIVRDLARTLGKEVEVVLSGEETEIDKTMIEDLSDPIIHLLRNAVDHGLEPPMERLADGKPEKGVVRLEARQEGDHIMILISDDGRGMNAERLRAKAIEKGLLSEEDANRLDERESFNLIFLPGFSTATQVSDVSGRGVGMDVVKTNINKLNGSIDIRSVAGKGTTFTIALPLTLAILQVLLVRLGNQPFAVPLSLVREILPILPESVQEVGRRATMVVRGEVLPVLPLTELISWAPVQAPAFGVLMQTAELSFILAVDSFAGRDDAVIKSLDDFRPKGVAGVTTLSNGQIVLILDMKELLSNPACQTGVTRQSLMPTALSASVAASGAAAAA